MLKLCFYPFHPCRGCFFQRRPTRSCTPLQDQVLSTVNPADDWGSTAELSDHAPPKRVGDWGAQYARPSSHFVTNQATNNMVAIQQFPYVGMLGIMSSHSKQRHNFVVGS